MAVAFALLAAVCWGSSAILIRLGLRGIRPTTGTLISLSSSLVMTLGAALLFSRDKFHIPLGMVPWLAVIGMANYGIGRVLNFAGVSMAGAARAGVIVSMSPLISTALAIVLTGERPALSTVFGTAFVVGGIILIMSEGLRGSAARPGAGAGPAAQPAKAR